ncbi:hypothetical protein CVD28_00075 [Bacillus sp. M6-12]|uniref:hypothetical protein n=1 Tax=Bacillus sp. M6-12 TaxID=2054166 RepID=UPI000C7605EB|nr:hypothetical protein [Bacillus sp. M6-12]PLS18833.1 hypothetical protein CVD28_00075 [Bacillus sp. M6-12]
MKKMGFIFFNVDRSKEELEVGKVKKVVGLKTNEDLKILSHFEYEIDRDNYTKSLYELLHSFEEWVQNPYETKFVTFEPNDMKNFMEDFKQSHYKSKIRDFHKIMSYQYWNIQNEMTYRLGLKKEHVSLEDLLSVYGLSFVGNKRSAKELCFNTFSLATHFKLDCKRNKEVFAKPTHPSKRTENQQESTFPLLDFKPIRATGEERLKQKMEEGWNISIECKAKGRGYGMTYEATAYHMDNSFGDRLTNMRFGVGKTLEELLDNLFKPEEDNPYAQEKREEYEELHSSLLT